MHSIAPVRSASGAAGYFAKDDYYTGDHAEGVSGWAGSGADALGLSGEIDKEAFERILNGELPSGEKVGQVENRQNGIDLTFSAPKSVSLMAAIGADKRIRAPDGAEMKAVRSTMAWVERNLAEGRKDIDGKKVPIRTGNLVYALFQHDTSRALDPQAHVHAVVANLTRMPDGKWQALHNGAIWRNNAVIGSIYHAYLRAELETLGYRIEQHGKHGTFEIVGVPKPVIDAFSRRREEILGKAAALGIKSSQGLRDVTARTRDPKVGIDDREALAKGWQERARSLGFDAAAIVAAARDRVADRTAGVVQRSIQAMAETIRGARDILGDLARPHDPLVDAGLARMTVSAPAARAQLAVASAVRILSQREAAFAPHQLAKTALDLGLRGVTVDHVEQRIGRLVEQGKLVPGEITRADGTLTMVTTRTALATEDRILAAIDDGKGRSSPIIAAAFAPARLQAAAAHPLNPGQLAAATLIVSSADRSIVVQGVAGAGKSTMLHAVARVAQAEGRTVSGLAFQNKMVADLQDGAGIEAQTVASFIIANERFLDDRHSSDFQAAREAMRDRLLVVDETSMLSSDDMLRLHRIVAALGVDKLVLVGDRQQLSSIDAGKAFAMIQAGGVTTARMDENIRQRNDTLRTVAALANVGKAGAAMKVLGDKVVEHADPAAHAAALWLGLDPSAREATAVFASGREARATINARIQDGLVAEGAVSGAGIHLTVFERVNATREELRYAASYRAGQTLNVSARIAELGLERGRYDVRRVLPNGKVELAGPGGKRRIDPQKLDPTATRDRLELTERKDLHLRDGDRIRWTANDKERGLHNAATARIVAIDAAGFTVETATRDRLTLGLGDPMLSRVDLAYALNMHMAQGITTDRAITVMASHERNLSNQRLFNVGVTRVRDDLTMVVDDRAKLERQLDFNTGNKTSALETVGRLDIDRRAGGSGRQLGPVTVLPDPAEMLGFPDAPALPDLPGEARGPGSSSPSTGAADPLAGLPPVPPARDGPLPPLPERSLGLDL